MERGGDWDGAVRLHPVFGPVCRGRELETEALAMDGPAGDKNGVDLALSRARLAQSWR
jgi:hypothetical protein